jgi:branched-chain amino acid transport system ATP-binding protein
MLTLAMVSKHFGGLEVLKDVNLTIPDVGIFGLIGPNGAGKTTVFNLITGLLVPDSGIIDFAGNRLNGLAPFEITRLGLARTFQNIRIFKEMTLLENVLVAMGDHPSYNVASTLFPWHRYRDAERRELNRARDLLYQVGLADKAGGLGGALSYGEQRRLEIARALATQPKLLLLDEPAAGMNTLEKQQLMKEIVKLEKGGLAILIIEHDMRFVMELSKEIAVMSFGRVIARGVPQAIRANTDVIEAYLGRDDEFESEDRSGWA